MKAVLQGGRLPAGALQGLRQAHALAPMRHGAYGRRIRRQAPLDIYCRAFDHPNLFVVDAGFLPTSAAVNPALTIAAQALRVADHICRRICAHDQRARRPRHRRPARHRAWQSPRRSPTKGFDLAITDIAEPQQVAADAQAAGGAAAPRSLYVKSDIADWRAMHRPSTRSWRSSAASIASSTMPASARKRAAIFSILRQTNYDTICRHQSARHGVFHAGGGESDAGAQPADGPRSIINITSVSAEMTSPERLDYCMTKAGLAAFTQGWRCAWPTGHQRVRCAPRHHPLRHDRGRRREIRQADRRGPGADEALGRAGRSRPHRRGAGQRRFQLCHGLRHQCRWRPFDTAGS